jgi:hypothetical protein
MSLLLQALAIGDPVQLVIPLVFRRASRVLALRHLLIVSHLGLVRRCLCWGLSRRCVGRPGAPAADPAELLVHPPDVAREDYANFVDLICFILRLVRLDLLRLYGESPDLSVKDLLYEGRVFLGAEVFAENREKDHLHDIRVDRGR